MTTEIVRRETATLPEKMDWVRTMATANLLPAQYRNNPGNLFFAIEYADALGVDRMAAITSIHVIEGKPSASADLIANLIRKAGHRLRVSGDDTHAIAQIIRADDPEFTYEARWDMDKARAAGLAGKGVWRNYPGAMLRSRAITEVARMGASDALFGVIYTPEELGAEIDDRGDIVHSVTKVEQQPVSGNGADRMLGMLGAQPPAATEPQAQPTEPAEQVEGITPPQVKKMAASMNDLGLTTRESALAYVVDVIGRPVDSRNDLTKDEASRVIDALERDAASAPVDAEIVPDPSSEAPASVGAEPNPEQVWTEIVAAGRQRGMSDDDVAGAFREAMGMIPDEATGHELAAFLHTFVTGEQTAVSA